MNKEEYGDELFIFAMMLQEEMEIEEKRIKKEGERDGDGNETD